jgi:DNA-binding response OmpR family regulator
MALKILLTDDEEDILEVVQDRLEAYGFIVVTARNGLEALKKLSLERFDGVFLDVKMPGIDGIQVLEEIRKKDLKLPVIILTSSSSREAAIESIAKGASGYVLKPFEWEELKGCIERVFNISI